ncbi:hypothetical protein M595_3568 [Lyngbya aestuarii BL J]|uniref:DUF1622 domain-containing protein n=1 Tax=Lyngbya aestuarii BL J TaxID=1348334 RepID=U7QJA6_9CYAN|nr:DUF1622 domain-containing protein [Lyngbya aestuarii]ERT06496.1 hypothetical protein M595_3568 [Lyngbya aestuarii BL J]
MGIELLENGLSVLVSLTKLILEAISVLCIIIGLGSTVKLVIRQPSVLRDLPFFKLRLCLGSWLALALEFQLGADILATTVSPSLQSLAKLGAIAIIRTFLNYFLSKELETERELQDKNITR